MPRINRRLRARRSDALTEEQMWALLLGAYPEAFQTPEQREKAWFRYREELMREVNPGCRPSAFWEMEHYEKLPGERDYQALHRLGLLTTEEKTLLRRWGWIE